MFTGCSSLVSIDLSGFDASKVTDARSVSVFDGCSKLVELTLPAGLSLLRNGLRYTPWRDSSGALYPTTSEMLSANAARASGAEVYSAISVTPGWRQSGTCEWTVDDNGLLTVRPLPGLKRGELENWGNKGAPWCSERTSIKSVVFDSGVSVWTCCGMFSGCSALISLDLSGLNTSKVKYMNDMFSGCKSLTTLDLSGLNTSQVTDMSYMFNGCSSLKTIFVSRLFTTAEVGSSDRMFDGCCLLVGGAGTAYDSSFVDSARARIDGGSDDPGYFTGKHEKLDGDVNGSGALNVVDAQIVYDIATTDFYKDRQDYADMRARADVTWDDEVDASDAFAIQYAALRGW